MSESWRFEIRKGDLAQTRWREEAAAPLKEGQARLAVRLFSFTSNNITYGLLGDQLGYWAFFPAPEGWGMIPVWGFADVVETRSAEFGVGERVYGYLPMAGAFNVEVGRASASGFVDVSAHRAERAPVYNGYVRAAHDPLYTAVSEAEQALFRPLFTTSFVIHRHLAAAQNYGATQIILSSASSKTALSTAFFLHGKGAKVIGLTSRANRAFVEKLGVYDSVVLYDEIASIARAPSVFIDYAGAGGVRNAVHAHLGDALAKSLIIGVTHWGEAGGPPPIGVAPTLFFAPDEIRLANQEWGAAEFERRLAAAWRDFLGFVKPWLKIESARDRAGLDRIYAAVRDGKIAPDVGAVVSLQD